MSGIARSAACLLILGLATAFTSAEAAVLRRSLGCATIHLVLTTPLGGTTNSSSVVMKNTGSSAIPAGTVYRYTIPAGSFEYTNPNALGSGATLSVQDARVTDSSACTASVPGTILKNLNNGQLNNRLTLNPG